MAKSPIANTSNIYTLKLPEEAFVEVYVGKNAYIDRRRKQELVKLVIDHKVDQFELLKDLCIQFNIGLKCISLDLETWALKATSI